MGADGEAGSGAGVPPPDGSDGGERPAGFVGCEETIEKLYTYLDGELTEQRRIEIVRHLDLCGPCVHAYGFETELRKLIANRCRDRVPESLIARVADALRAESTSASN